MARGNPKVEAMAKIPLFEHCSKSDLGRIARIADEIDVPAGHVLMREGERGREAFVLLHGDVEVRRGGRKIATRHGGEVVGEIALVSDVPRTATVTATTPLRLLVMTDRDFRRLLREAPALQAKVLRALADRLGDVV